MTANLWTVLDVQPLVGRVFTEDEDARDVRVAVLSYGLWQRRFGGSRDVLGPNITGEEFDDGLSKAEASKRIDELRERSPRLSRE